MLSGAYVLIVEDEYLIALTVQRVLESAGARQAVIVGSTAQAVAHPAIDACDLALIAISPDHAEAAALCSSLVRAGVAVVAVSSVGTHRRGVPGLNGVETVLKPFTDEDLLAAANAALLAAAHPSDVTS